MSVFDKMSPEKIKDAQNQLNSFCALHDMVDFPIRHTSHKSQKWRAIVLRMCGLDVPDPIRGRNPDSDLEKAGALAYLYFDLCGYKPEDLIDDIIKQYRLKPKKSGHITESDLRESIRTARKKYKGKIEKLTSKTTNKEANPDTQELLASLEKMMEY